MRRGGEATIPPRDTINLAGLLESTLEVAATRFGAATTNRVTGEDVWTVHQGPGWSLRIRASPMRDGSAARVRSWTLALDEGYETLAAACEALGLGSADVPERPDESMLRCALRNGDSDHVHSLTAQRRRGRIRSVTAFDEAPDWESEADG